MRARSLRTALQMTQLRGGPGRGAAGHLLADGGDLIGLDGRRGVRTPLTDVGDDRGDVRVRELAPPGHHPGVRLPCDLDRALEPAEHDADGRLRRTGDPLGAEQRRERAGNALPVLLVTPLAVALVDGLAGRDR